ncbi:MAG TPA: nucleotidyltransferase family protein [Candidatus Deferrimicrobiaceae bacterium]|nr:nucleotidyltransferase family protein [Candidatus Deferrimicrobiaceae bacterium]
MKLPTASVNAEWNVLLAATSPDSGSTHLDRLGLLLEEPIHWDLLLRLADQHGVTSLLYQSLEPLTGLVPAAISASLRQGYERNIHKSLFLTRELIRILDCVGQLGIEVIPYKGIVLSELYYGDIALRQCGDMDLFVRQHDVVRIRTAVRDLGYTPRLLIPADAEREYIASGYECTFDSPAGKNLLELQWAPQPRFYAVNFDMQALFERSRNVTVAGRVMKTPSPEDLLLILSMHAAKHVWGRLIWLRDIAQILKRENLNWDWIQSQARTLGIKRILHITLVLANALLGAAIPPTLEPAVGEDKSAQMFAEQVAVSIASGVTYEEEKLSYFRLMMRLRERRTDRLRFLARLTFTPGPGEWEAVHLPKPLFPLYRIVRLARLASRLAR